MRTKQVITFKEGFKMIKEIDKIISPIKIKIGEKYYNVFCHIQFKDKRLNISGVEAPLHSGSCVGSCGQINIGYEDLSKLDIKYNCFWDKDLFKKFLDIWGKYHLNDLNAGCIHQRELLKNIKNYNYDKLIKIPEFKNCPICSYAYGSKWLFEKIPIDIIKWLNRLPNTTIKPAWI